jgi:hypothetical protein
VTAQQLHELLPANHAILVVSWADTRGELFDSRAMLLADASPAVVLQTLWAVAMQAIPHTPRPWCVVFTRYGETCSASDIVDWNQLVLAATHTKELRDATHVAHVSFVSAVLSSPLHLGDKFGSLASVDSSQSGHARAQPPPTTSPELISVTSATELPSLVVSPGSDALSVVFQSTPGDKVALATAILRHSESGSGHLKFVLHASSDRETTPSRNLQILQVIVRQQWRLCWLHANPMDLVAALRRQPVAAAGVPMAADPASAASTSKMYRTNPPALPLHLATVSSVLQWLPAALYLS